MRDILEIICEALADGKNDDQVKETLAQELIDTLNKLKCTDIGPYLSCQFDSVHEEYVITLRLPITSDIFDTSLSDGE